MSAYPSNNPLPLLLYPPLSSYVQLRQRCFTLLGCFWIGYTEPKKECGRKVFPLWHFWNVDQLMHGQARVICGTFFYGLACSVLGIWNTFAAGCEWSEATFAL